MKIGIDARELRQNRITGIGRYLKNFLEGSELTGCRHEYALFGFSDIDMNFRCGNIAHSVISHSLSFVEDQILIAMKANEAKIDLFFSPYYKIPLRLKCRSVITIHDLIHFEFGGNKERFFYNGMQKILSSVYISKADRIIAPSGRSKESVLRFFPQSADKVNVVTECAGTGFYRRLSSEISACRKLCGMGDREYILCVGNYNPHKNIAGLINSYLGLPVELTGRYDLVIVAKKSGKEFNRIYDEVNKTGPAGLIHFIDFLTEDNLAALYSGASLFVFPSFIEGFGLPPVEAMACGCPVAASNAPPMPEVLKDACVYFNPHSIEDMTRVMKRALTDDELRKSLVEKGLKRTSEMSPEKMAYQILDIFEEVLK